MASFRALRLNLGTADTVESVLLDADTWLALEGEPERRGPYVLGLDLGQSAAMTAAAAYWPESLRLEIYAAFPATPSLEDRGTSDGCGSIYRQSWDRGELQTFAGRVTPLGAFLLHLAASLAGAEIAGAASDMYRQSEVLQALEEETLEWNWSFRRMGSGSQGSADVRAFQRAILRGEFKTLPSLLMPLALKSTILRRDGNGNPALERGNTGRIDVLSACVLSAGLAAGAAGDGGFGISQVAFG